MENWYSRTLSVDSGGGRVDVGYFGSGGLDVSSYWDDSRNSYLGVSSSRKSENCNIEHFETLNIEILEIKLNNKVYKLIN